MRISTKGRYGLRALLDLACHYKGESIPLNEIARRQQVSEKYMEQLFSILKKEGLVISMMGSQGGYMLSRKPEDITVGEVLLALEGSLSLVDEENMDARYDEKGYKLDKYLFCEVWSKINEEVYNLITTTTLKDLLDEHNTKWNYYKLKNRRNFKWMKEN